MPPIYYLNPPPNPFWSFVSDLETHPFFSGFPEHVREGPPPQGRPAWGARSQPSASQQQQTEQPQMSETARGKQPTVEDPPEVDPSTVKPENTKDEPRTAAWGRRGRCGRPEREDREARRERRHPCGRPGRGPPGGWSGHPFMFGGHPFARPPWAGSPGPEQRGPSGPPPHHEHPRGPPPHARGPYGHRSPRRDFDLGEFLNNLGNKLGIDISGAAEGLGLTADRFTAGRTGEEVNFEPNTDIFENAATYIIHCSLPGVRKEDVSVDYDGENSLLKVTGISHKPGVDEELMKQLAVEGRKRETGLFEKVIRLGTKRDPASIDVAAITAKMDAGVLIVKVPKVETTPAKREVPISADPVTEGEADYEDEYSEKPVLFDASEQASVVGTEHADVPTRGEISLVDMAESEPKGKETQVEQETKPSSKEEEAQKKTETTRASTEREQLPAYSAEDAHSEEEDWEKFSDASGEAEYIKIDVK